MIKWRREIKLVCIKSRHVKNYMSAFLVYNSDREKLWTKYHFTSILNIFRLQYLHDGKNDQ